MRSQSPLSVHSFAVRPLTSRLWHTAILYPISIRSFRVCAAPVPIIRRRRSPSPPTILAVMAAFHREQIEASAAHA